MSPDVISSRTADDLDRLVAAELAAPQPRAVEAFAGRLAQRFEEAAAVLFYGSVLRTGDFSGVLDFYVLVRRPRRGPRGLATRVLWPDVSYVEETIDSQVLRAKIASMTVGQFERAVTGDRIDTTIWTRFAQPAALVWARDATQAAAVRSAVARAAVTASRTAAAVGPDAGAPGDFWAALFRQTYAAEFRVEASGRERQILGADPQRYDRLLLAAWRAGGLDYAASGETVSPRFPDGRRAALLKAWRLRRNLGRPLNLARLVKAAFTFEGAARYAAWKIERHTGLAVPLTPWRERHPILAAPGVLWRLWKARR
jgi:hypothetical protein